MASDDARDLGGRSGTAATDGSHRHRWMPDRNYWVDAPAARSMRTSIAADGETFPFA